MAIFDYQKKEINLKIVYYGPGLSGKTSNLQYIFDHTRAENKGKLVSLATQTDRTLFFDFLPLELGSLGGYKMRFHLYTVPGQVHYDATRKLVLKGVDGIVFVADSQREMKEANIQSFVNMEKNLLSYNKKLKELPVVLQANKRDLPEVMSMEELNLLLNRYQFPSVEASATTGMGVLETLRLVTRLVIRSIQDRVGAEVEAAPPAVAKPAAARPAPPPAAPKPAVPPPPSAVTAAGRPAKPAPQPEPKPEPKREDKRAETADAVPPSRPLLIEGAEQEQTLLFRFPFKGGEGEGEIQLALKVRLRVEEGRLVGEARPAAAEVEPEPKVKAPASAPSKGPKETGSPAPSRVWEPPAPNLPPLVTLGEKGQTGGGGEYPAPDVPPPLEEMGQKGPDRPEVRVSGLPPLGEEAEISFGSGRAQAATTAPAAEEEAQGGFNPREEDDANFNTSAQELEFTDNALDEDAAQRQQDLAGTHKGGGFFGAFRKKR